MRKLSFWRACLLTGLVLLLPGLARAQSDATGYAAPDPNWPVPFSNRPDLGGFYCAAEFVMYRQTNPLTSQNVAYRGFVDVDGSIGAALGNGLGAGQFYGTKTLALDTHQVSGPNDYQPGTKIDLGYKFYNGGSISISWLYLTEHKTQASATSAPFALNVGVGSPDSFLFSPVYGFPPDYGGAFGVNFGGARKIAIGNPLAPYGIWNAATIETISFLQRVQQYEITWRDVVFETENYRLSYLVGPRFFWIWERFQWRTSDVDLTGQGGPLDTAIYNNTDSNRMYGAHAGFSSECYIGKGFALQFDIEGALFLNVIRERQEYTTGARYGLPQVTAESKRTQTQWGAVPEINGDINLVWYPIQSVQLRLGYNAMAFFNTISSPRPIDFNYGSLTAPYHSTFRFFDGLNVGVAVLW
jgi:hypothetical protein